MRSGPVLKRLSPSSPLELISTLADEYMRAYEGFEEYSSPNMDEAMRYIRWLLGERRKRSLNPVFLVALSENPEEQREEHLRREHLMGFVAGDSYWVDGELGETLNLHELVVLKPYRGRGLAKTLIRAFVEISNADNKKLIGRELKNIMLWVGERNAPARALYEGLGFEYMGRVGHWLKMRADVDDLISQLRGVDHER